MVQNDSAVFVNFRNYLENFGNSSKMFFQMILLFLKFSENLRKSSKVFRNIQKLSENVGNGLKVFIR